MTTGFAVTNVQLGSDGSVVLDFLLEPDLKRNGVQMHRKLVVPGAGQYDDEIDAVRDAAGALLMDVLEDFPGLEPMSFDDDDEDDD